MRHFTTLFTLSVLLLLENVRANAVGRDDGELPLPNAGGKVKVAVPKGEHNLYESNLKLDVPNIHRHRKGDIWSISQFDSSLETGPNDTGSAVHYQVNNFGRSTNLETGTNLGGLVGSGNSDFTGNSAPGNRPNNLSSSSELGKVGSTSFSLGWSDSGPNGFGAGTNKVRFGSVSKSTLGEFGASSFSGLGSSSSISSSGRLDNPPNLGGTRNTTSILGKGSGGRRRFGSTTSAMGGAESL